MSFIYKYPLAITGRQTLVMPDGARPLAVQMQGGTPQLWALVDPNEESRNVEIEIYGTGHAIKHPNTLTHLGTFQMDSSGLVFHVFRRP